MLQFNQIISYMAHIGTDTSLSLYKHIANTFSKMNQMYMPEVKMHHFHFHPTYGLKLRIILRSRSDFDSAATRIVEDSITKQFTTLKLVAPPPYHQRGTDSEFCTICDSEMNHKATQ